MLVQASRRFTSRAWNRLRRRLNLDATALLRRHIAELFLRDLGLGAHHLMRRALLAGAVARCQRKAA